MKEFARWAKAHGITFKRVREERAAYAVWKACRAESAERDKLLIQLKTDAEELAELLKA